MRISTVSDINSGRLRGVMAAPYGVSHALRHLLLRAAKHFVIYAILAIYSMHISLTRLLSATRQYELRSRHFTIFVTREQIDDIYFNSVLFDYLIS